MPTLNLGVLAHVDAGKTSLTERLLFDTGAIGRLGSVDGGDTATDTLALERRRGITIKNNVASFSIGDLTVNLIDTPGHPDFIAEVERALRVLDGAVLVVSAVEGVQAQTRVILRMLRRLCVPTLVFVNKTDRTGADADAVIRGIADAVPLWVDSREALAELDDRALAAFADDGAIPVDVLPRLVADGRALPAYRGSAITGQGVSALLEGIATLLPRAAEGIDGPLEAVVFAIDRDHTASVRVRSGMLRLRDRIGADRVTAIDDGHADALPAGHIGRVRGLRSARIGDRLGVGGRVPSVFPPPTLSAVVMPRDPARRGELHTALQRLAEQDPLIDLRVDQRTGELSVTLYGEVQKQVLSDTLAEEDGIEVSFGDSTVILRERVARAVSVGAVMQQDGNRHCATLSLTVAPSDGTPVRITAPREELPLHIFGTIEAFTDAMGRYLREAFARGPHGWEVIDSGVTVTRSGYTSPVTGAADFRRLTGELVDRALSEAGTILCEPVQRVAVEGPDGTLPAVLSAVAAAGGSIEDAGTTGDVGTTGTRVIVTATIPATRLPDLERAVPGATHGEGVIEAVFARWQPVSMT